VKERRGGELFGDNLDYRDDSLPFILLFVDNFFCLPYQFILCFNTHTHFGTKKTQSQADHSAKSLKCTLHYILDIFH
jgi:hypothetical protein